MVSSELTCGLGIAEPIGDDDMKKKVAVAGAGTPSVSASPGVHAHYESSAGLRCVIRPRVAQRALLPCPLWHYARAVA